VLLDKEADRTPYSIHVNQNGALWLKCKIQVQH